MNNINEKKPYNGINIDDHHKTIYQNITTKKSINDNYPALSSLDTLFSIQSRTPESLKSGETDYMWTMKTTIDPILQGLKDYGDEKYLNAATSLNSVRTIYNRIGGTSVQRDIIEQTFIEALLRGDANIEAKLILLERTHFTPNDAQSWRRLASLFGRSGDKKLADFAHYTAWQLGIGQGGFGGQH